MGEITATRIAKFIWNMLPEDFAVSLHTELVDIPNVHADIRAYLHGLRSSMERLENFLHRYPFMFFIENKRVIRYDPDFHSARRKTVSYFKDTLKGFYNGPIHYTSLKGHIGQADVGVQDFVNKFYPEESFKNFLETYPETFVVFQNGTVFLTVEAEEAASDTEESSSDEEDEDANESVDYFENALEDFGDGRNFMHLRGHVGQAPLHVQEYIHRNFPGERFLDFLHNNDDVFEVREGAVFLRP